MAQDIGASALSGRKIEIDWSGAGLACLTGGLNKAANAVKAAKKAGLTEKQAQKLRQFENNIPKKGREGETRIFNLPNGGKAFQKDVPANNIPGGKATYEKQVDAAGNTLNYSKTTYRPDGTIVQGASSTKFQSGR